MRLPRSLRRAYRAHESWVKLGGFLAFLLIIASLYFVVLAGPKAGSGIALTTASPSAGASLAAPTNAPAPTVSLPQPPTPTPLPGPYQVKTQRNLVYGPYPAQHLLDICTPVGARGLRPGVVLIHGGGFYAGDKQSYFALCNILASYGFVATTINYRLAPFFKWPAQIVDVQLAVRWLRSHAGDYGLDGQRLCALGDSAGGHLAVSLGVWANNIPGDFSGTLANQSPKVACVVDEFGPVDFVALRTNSFWHGALSSLFGDGTVAYYPETLRAASPLYQVSPQSAPMLIVQGTTDDTVPPSQSQALQQALQQAGVPVSYISFVGGHAFSGVDPPHLQAIQNQVLAFLIQQEQP